MSGIEPTKSHRLTKDDIALMARELVLVTLPHKDPGNIPRWKRQNGNITLAIQPGYKDDPKDRKKSVCIGYPYGSIARLIIYWMVTEARRTGEQKLWLGKSFADFMRKLGIEPNYGGGKRSSANSARRQLERLIYARVTLEKEIEDGERRGRADFDLPVTKARELWWNAKDTEQKMLWESYIVLNDDFFKAVLLNPVPVRMITLLALKKSPLGLDLYAWITYESYKAQHHRKGRFVAWKLLHEQFGSEISRLDNFVAKAKRELQKIMLNCSSIKLSFERGGVHVLAGSLPDVSPKATREALQPPPRPLPVLTDAPSSEAIEKVMQMDTTEGAITIAMKFRQAVGRGKAENTDEAFLSFANQYLGQD